MRYIARGMAICLLCSPALLGAQDTPAQSHSAPDNTKVNQRDRNASEATADQQKDNRSDREITRDIRQSLVKDKSLSTYAHNVKVITQAGKVTLKGPVRSDDEKLSVEQKAAAVAGTENVTDQLQVNPKQ